MRRFFAGVFAVFALTLTACSGGGGSPDTVVQEFIKAVDRQDADKALSYFSYEGINSDAIPATRGKLQMMIGEMSSRFSRNNGVDKVNIKESTLDAAKTAASVTVSIAFKNGRNLDENFRLKKEKNNWKIVLR